MKIFLYVLFGIIVSYAFFWLGEIGIALLSGSAFGLLLFIAVNINKNNKSN